MSRRRTVMLGLCAAAAALEGCAPGTSGDPPGPGTGGSAATDAAPAPGGRGGGGGAAGSGGSAGAIGPGRADAGGVPDASGAGGRPAADAGGGGGAGGAGALDGGAPPAGGSGCGKPWMAPDIEVERRNGRPPMQVARRTIAVAGVNREYLVAVPMPYDPAKPYALVFGFHGSGGTREQLRGYMNVETPAAGEAIFIYPSGLAPASGGSTQWNLSATSPDLTLVDMLLEQYAQELCIDRKRVFATGHSFGGCMSNAIGCYRRNSFRAVAPVAGCSGGGGRNTQCPGQIAALMIHSPKDTQTTFSGAIGSCTRYLRASSCDEMPACGCHWPDAPMAANQCQQMAQQPYQPMVALATSERDEQPPVARSYLGCDPGYPVVFIEHWRRERAAGDAGERWHNPPPWSGAVIWEFFTKLPAR